MSLKGSALKGGERVFLKTSIEIPARLKDHHFNEICNEVRGWGSGQVSVIHDSGGKAGLQVFIRGERSKPHGSLAVDSSRITLWFAWVWKDNLSRHEIV